MYEILTSGQLILLIMQILISVCMVLLDAAGFCVEDCDKCENSVFFHLHVCHC